MKWLCRGDATWNLGPHGPAFGSRRHDPEVGGPRKRIRGTAESGRDPEGVEGAPVVRENGTVNEPGPPGREALRWLVV